MTREKVLSLLKEAGESYCSGQSMSRALGLSRAAVWKAIDALRQEGYRISSVPHRGYRLEQAPDLLSAGELTGALSDCVLGQNVICLDSVDSTNNYAKKLGDQGAPHGTVVVTDHQTTGRGRRGNSFLSPAGKGLYLSVLLRPQLPPAEVVNLTAWIAVAVCDAVEQVIGERPGIKWTNDLILRQKKLCGILTEMSLEAETGELQYVVAGIGLNVSHSDADFGTEVSQLAISLEQALGRKIRRIDLAAAVVRALDRMMADFPHQKAAYLERYRNHCLTLGREVRLIRKGEAQIAFAQAIDEDFALVVRHSDGTTETVTAGDVSVRGLLGYV